MHSHSTPEVAVLSTLILFCENAVLASRLVHEPTFKITTPRAHGLSQSSGFSLGFEQAQDVVNFDCSQNGPSVNAPPFCKIASP